MWLFLCPFLGKGVMRHEEDNISERRLMCHGNRIRHGNGGNVMAKKLDAEQIEQARHRSEKSSRREEEKKRIQETIAKNRSGERKGTVIMPERKMYAYQEAAKVRVAAYCRVSTENADQKESLETQKERYETWIKRHSDWEFAGVYYDMGISGTHADTRDGLQALLYAPRLSHGGTAIHAEHNPHSRCCHHFRSATSSSRRT